MKGMVYFLLLSIFFISSCGDTREREAALQKKEAELAQREQALALREKLLERAEVALDQARQQLVRAQPVDSIAPDSTALDTAGYNASVLGKWSVRMACTETTCPGSAVGDTKFETWELTNQDNQITAQAFAEGKLVRVYSGTYENNVLELTADVALSPAAPATKMLVRLNSVNESTLEGQREIVRTGDCRIIYALQLNKQVE